MDGFAAACYNDNSVRELTKALVDGPDNTDMKEWGIGPDEWHLQVEQALIWKLEDNSK